MAIQGRKSKNHAWVPGSQLDCMLNMLNVGMLKADLLGRMSESDGDLAAVKEGAGNVHDSLTVVKECLEFRLWERSREPPIQENHRFRQEMASSRVLDQITHHVLFYLKFNITQEAINVQVISERFPVVAAATNPWAARGRPERGSAAS